MAGCSARSCSEASSGRWQPGARPTAPVRSEEHTSELQSQSNLVCRLLLEKKKELPDVVRRLEQDAQKMRQRLEELNDALGGKGTDGPGKVGDAVPCNPHDRIVADL